MSERTIFSVFAILNLFGKFSTEFNFIFFYMIETFYSIMSKRAFVPKLTFISFRMIAKFRWIVVISSSLIFNGVEIMTVLMIMLMLYVALIYFKFVKVQMLNLLFIALFRVDCLEYLIHLLIRGVIGFSSLRRWLQVLFHLEENIIVLKKYQIIWNWSIYIRLWW